MKVVLALLVALGWCAKADGASTLRELLIKTQANPEQQSEAQIEDHLVEQMRTIQPELKMFAKAWRTRQLAEPGCGRFTLELSVATPAIVKQVVATVELDLCEDGLPPNPKRLDRMQ